MNPFFITGLPRSRTAWLANLFTTDRSFCYHDLSRTNRVPGVLEACPFDFVGDSDSGLLAYVDTLVARYPNARWLFLKNNVEKATKSFERYFTNGNEYPGTKGKDIHAAMVIAQKLYDAALPKVPNRLEVCPEAFDDAVITKQIWHWLLPLPWNQQRYNMLNTFRINIILQKLCLL